MPDKAKSGNVSHSTIMQKLSLERERGENREPYRTSKEKTTPGYEMDVE